MEVDTVAAVPIISNKTFNSIPNFLKLSLQPTPDTFRTYTGEIIPVLEKLSIQVEYHNQNATMPLLAVQNEGPNLIGWNLLAQIQLDWKVYFQSRMDSHLKVCWCSTVMCFKKNLELSKMLRLSYMWRKIALQNSLNLSHFHLLYVRMSPMNLITRSKWHHHSCWTLSLGTPCHNCD